MKRIVLVTLLLSLVVAFAFSQQMSVGAKLGVPVTWATGDDWEDLLDEADADNKAKVGFAGGGFFAYDFTDMFGVQVEALFGMYRLGATGELGGDDVELIGRIMVLDIPVLAQAKLPAGPGAFTLFLGPDLLLAVGDFELTVEVDGDEVEDFTEEPDNRLTFGAVVGLGYQMMLGPGYLAFDARYLRQFTSFSEDDVFTSNVLAYVGYGYNL